MAVSVIGGSVLRCPYSKSPTIFSEVSIGGPCQYFG